MRYYVFRAQLHGDEVTITCSNYRKCPLISGNLLMMGVLHLKETTVPNASVETISIPKKDISYYTECYAEEEDEIENTESEEDV